MQSVRHTNTFGQWPLVAGVAGQMPVVVASLRPGWKPSEIRRGSLVVDYEPWRQMREMKGEVS